MLCCTNTDEHEFSRDLALFGLSDHLRPKLNSIYTALNLSKTIWISKDTAPTTWPTAVETNGIFIEVRRT
mgnify:CR=1 FL=1